jgi:hypothetical protein
MASSPQDSSARGIQIAAPPFFYYRAADFVNMNGRLVPWQNEKVDKSSF